MEAQEQEKWRKLIIQEGLRLIKSKTLFETNNENKGPGIRELYNTVGVSGYGGPWCGVFVSAVLKAAGINTSSEFYKQLKSAGLVYKYSKRDQGKLFDLSKYLNNDEERNKLLGSDQKIKPGDVFVTRKWMYDSKNQSWELKPVHHV